MRLPRAFFPACIVHATTRGNDGQAVFIDDVDRQRFLALARAVCERVRAALLAYCLMGNHIHMLGQSQKGDVDGLMRLLLGAYARWFNRRHGRRGHLFEERYFARVVADTDYLHEAGRYIHMNPVEAGLAAAPEEYAWSSFRAILAGQGDGLVDVDALREPFTIGGRFDAEAFRRFTLERHAGRRACDNEGGDRPWPPGWLESIATRFETLSLEILNGCRRPQAAAARGVALLLLVETLSCPEDRLAALFSLSGRASVSRAVSRAREERDGDPERRAACAGWAEALRGVN